MKNIAIVYSPRGFANESRVIVVPASEVAKTKSAIWNDSSAFIFTGKIARAFKAQWKRDVLNGAEIETQLHFF